MGFFIGHSDFAMWGFSLDTRISPCGFFANMRLRSHRPQSEVTLVSGRSLHTPMPSATIVALGTAILSAYKLGG